MRRQGSIHRSFEARALCADATLYAHCWFVRVAPPALPKGFSPSRVKLALDGGARTAVARADGGFQFSDVLPGVYLLEATAVGYSFPQLRVDVSAKHKSVRWAMYSSERRQRKSRCPSCPIKGDTQGHRWTDQASTGRCQM